MSAGQVITEAWRHLSGVPGDMAIALELRKPVPKPVILRWVNKLRRAADKLEELLND
jgi:hypothetical protein